MVLLKEVLDAAGPKTGDLLKAVWTKASQEINGNLIAANGLMTLIGSMGFKTRNGVLVGQKLADALVRTPQGLDEVADLIMDVGYVAKNSKLSDPRGTRLVSNLVMQLGGPNNPFGVAKEVYANLVYAVRYSETLSPSVSKIQMASIRAWMNQAGSASVGFLQGRRKELMDFVNTPVGPDEFKMFLPRIGRQEYDTVIYKKAEGISGQYRAVESKMLSAESATIEKITDALRLQFKKYVTAHQGQGKLTQLTYSVVDNETGRRIRMILGEKSKSQFTEVKVNNVIVDYIPKPWIDFKVTPLP
jgi:hypothetical protein